MVEISRTVVPVICSTLTLDDIAHLEHRETIGLVGNIVQCTLIKNECHLIHQLDQNEVVCVGIYCPSDIHYMFVFVLISAIFLLNFCDIPVVALENCLRRNCFVSLISAIRSINHFQIQPTMNGCSSCCFHMQ